MRSTRRIFVVVALVLSCEACTGMEVPGFHATQIETLRAVGIPNDGYCRQGAEVMDIASIVSITNKSLGIGAANFTIEGEDVLIEDPSAGITRVIQVDKRLSAKKDLDIELTFALAHGELVLFWRETYSYKKYEQGLLRIVETDLEEICRGSAGADEGH